MTAMKRLTIWICAVLFLSACQSGPTARISATIEGAPDSALVLQKLNYNRLTPVDTIRTDREGRFSHTVSLKGNEPYFYYLYMGDQPVASMILLPSDHVSITVPADGSFTIDGSEESALFKEVNDEFKTASDLMQAMVDSLGETEDAAQIKRLNTEMARLYVDYKRSAIKHIVSHPKSITSAVLLFRRFSDDLPVFGQETDAILFKTVQDSIAKVYPKSEFLTALRDEVDFRAKALELSSRFGEATVINFPDLVMPDVEGNLQKLSDLEGNVIVLSFWSVGQTEHKMFNVDLKDLYSRYHDRGLEVYQVSLDIDKPTWAATVRSQGLPWISVNDGYGIQSTAVTTYNIDHIPSLFVIGRDGSLVASDVFEKDALEQQVKRLL